MTARLSEKTDCEMTNSTDFESEKIAANSANLSSEKPTIAYFLLIPLAFLFALGACLLHNFMFCESRIVLATDGKHFLTTVQAMVPFLSHLCFGTPISPSFLQDSNLANHIMLDGPLMSTIYAPLFMLLGKVPDPRDWILLVTAQSVFHALSTAGLVYLVLRITKSPLFAAVAILLYGLYPAAVLQSGHFMSEIPITTLLIALVLSLTGTVPRLAVAVIGGVAAGLIVLTKPALIPCVLVVAFIGIIRSPRKVKPLSGLILGLSIVMLAWGIFSNYATGKFVPTAQRQPLYNVVTGWNVEANGWAHTPSPAFTRLFTEDDGPADSAKGVWISRPKESLQLVISKLSRLSSCPWNDFKGRALGLDANAQVLFHRILLAFAAFGTAIYFWCSRHFLNQAQRTIILIGFSIIVSHLCYVLVECQPRYTFTAMPFVVLLAAYGIWQAAQIPFEDRKRRLIFASSAAFALTLVGLLLHAENLASANDPRNMNEKTHPLVKSDRLERIINLSSIKRPAMIRSAFILVDGDKNIESSSVQINGVPLKVPLLSTMHFDSEHYVLFDQFREFAPAMRISVDDLRQWRAIPIDSELINWNGENKIVLVSKSKEATIYGDGRYTRYAYSPDYCNYGILAAAPVAAGSESRFIDPVLTAACGQQSYLSSLSEDGTTTKRLKDSLRIRLVVIPASSNPVSLNSASSNPANSNSANPNPASSNLANSNSANSNLASSNLANSNLGSKSYESVFVKVNRNNFDAMLHDTGSTDALRMNKTVLYAARRVGADIKLPGLKQQSSHVRIRVTGDLKALHNAGEVGILCALKGANGRVQILGKNPRSLQAEPRSKKFVITDVMPLDLLGGKAEALEIALYPCPWMEGQYGVSRRACDALFRNITIEIAPADLPGISGKRLVY